MREEGINTPHTRCTQREPFSQICDQNVNVSYLFSLGDKRFKRLKKIFIRVLDEIAGLTPMYSQV